MGYLERIKEKETTSLNIKNRAYLDITTDLNEDIMFYRKEIEEIAFDINNWIEGGNKKTLVITASRGSGKSALIKNLLEEFKQKLNLKYKYINCNNLRNSFQIAKNIIQETKKISYDVTFERMKKLFEGMNKKIIVFDEADLMEDSRLLYSLTRDNSFRNTMLILISNKIKFFSNLNKDIQSSITEKTYYLDYYKASEIYEILKLRAKHSLKKYDESKIKLIAAYNTQQFESDVRIGIKALSEVFERDDFNKYNDEDILKIMQDQTISIQIKVINSLNDNKLFLLKLLTEFSNSNILYEKYCQRRSKISRAYFSKLITDLDLMDLLNKQNIRQGMANTIKYTLKIYDEAKKEIDFEIERREKDSFF